MRGFGSSSTGAPNARPRQDHYSRRPGPRGQPRPRHECLFDDLVPWSFYRCRLADLFRQTAYIPLAERGLPHLRMLRFGFAVQTVETGRFTSHTVGSRCTRSHPAGGEPNRPREAPSAPPPGRGMLLLSRRGARIGGRIGRPWVANPRCFLALIKIKQLSQRTAISCCRRCSAVRTQDCSKATGAQRCRLALICSRGLESKMSKPVQM